jgi:hypothetical protein
MLWHTSFQIGAFLIRFLTTQLDNRGPNMLLFMAAEDVRGRGGNVTTPNQWNGQKANSKSTAKMRSETGKSAWQMKKYARWVNEACWADI